MFNMRVLNPKADTEEEHGFLLTNQQWDGSHKEGFSALLPCIFLPPLTWPETFRCPLNSQQVGIQGRFSGMYLNSHGI